MAKTKHAHNALPSICYCQGESGIYYGPYMTLLYASCSGNHFTSIVTRPYSRFFFRYRSDHETQCVKLLWQFLLAFRLAIAHRWTCRCDEAGCASPPYSSAVEDPQPKLGFDEDRVFNCDALRVQVTASMLRLPHILYQVGIVSDDGQTNGFIFALIGCLGGT